MVNLKSFELDSENHMIKEMEKMESIESQATKLKKLREDAQTSGCYYKKYANYVG